MGQSEESKQKIERAAQAYWQTAATLTDYRTLYDEGSTRIDKDFDSLLSHYIAVPEVLVLGPIEPTEIAWASAMLVNVKLKRY